MPQSFETSYTQLAELIEKRKEYERREVVSLKTSYAFKDVEGINLLSYAIFLNETHPDEFDKVLKLIIEDIAYDKITDDQIIEMLQDALTAALQVDNLTLVQKILNIRLPSEKKDNSFIQVDLDEVAFANCQENCKEFIKTIFKETIAEKDKSPELKEIALARAAEIGNLDFIQNNPLDKKTAAKLLKLATQNNQLEIVHYLIENKNIAADPNSLNLLTEAMNYAADDVFQYLLTIANSSLLNEMDGAGASPLMNAVIIENMAAVKQLLDKGALLNLQTVSSDTIFHLAAAAGDFEILTLLLQKDKEAAKLASQQDVYGRTARDMAVLANSDGSHDKIIAFLDENYPNLKSTTVNLSEAVDQNSVLKKMNYFLRLDRRISHQLDQEGCCNGFLFLSLFYTSMGKRDHFFDVLAQLANWDGTVESLKKEFAEPYKDDQGKIIYHNLAELFEQWINDVVWFHHLFSTSESGIISNLKQKDRSAQLNIINNESSFAKVREVRSIFTSPLSLELSEQQIDELIKYMGNMPSGTAMEISGGPKEKEAGHVVGFMVGKEGLSFYGANRPYKPKEYLSIEQVSRLINEVSTYKQSIFQYYIYSFNDPKKAKVLSLNDFCKLLGVQDVQDVPSPQGVAKFQANSANGFTPMHLAIITNNLVALRYLLNSGHDYSLQDAHKRSPWDLAKDSNNFDAMILFVKHAFKVSPDKGIALLNQIDFKGNTLLHGLATKGDLNNIKKILDRLTPVIGHSLLEKTNDKKETVLDIIFQTIKLADCYPVLHAYSAKERIQLLKREPGGQALWQWAVEDPKNICMLLEGLSFNDYHAAMISASKTNFLGDSFYTTYRQDALVSIEHFKKLIDCYPEKYHADLVIENKQLLFDLAKDGKFDILAYALTFTQDKQLTLLFKKNFDGKALIDYFSPQNPAAIRCLQTLISNSKNNEEKIKVLGYKPSSQAGKKISKSEDISFIHKIARSGKVSAIGEFLQEINESDRFNIIAPILKDPFYLSAIDEFSAREFLSILTLLPKDQQIQAKKEILPRILSNPIGINFAELILNSVDLQKSEFLSLIIAKIAIQKNQREALLALVDSQIKSLPKEEQPKLFILADSTKTASILKVLVEHAEKKEKAAENILEQVLFPSFHSLTQTEKNQFISNYLANESIDKFLNLYFDYAKILPEERVLFIKDLDPNVLSKYMDSSLRKVQIENDKLIETAKEAGYDLLSVSDLRNEKNETVYKELSFNKISQINDFVTKFSHFPVHQTADSNKVILTSQQATQFLADIESRKEFTKSIHLDEYFTLFTTKASKMRADAGKGVAYLAQADAAEAFCLSLKTAKTTFLQTGNKDTLKTSCQTAVETSREVLANHRKLGGLIRKFIIDVVNTITCNSFNLGLFAKTSSAKKLDSFEEDVVQKLPKA